MIGLRQGGRVFILDADKYKPPTPMDFNQYYTMNDMFHTQHSINFIYAMRVQRHPFWYDMILV